MLTDVGAELGAEINTEIGTEKNSAMTLYDSAHPFDAHIVVPRPTSPLLLPEQGSENGC